MLFLEIACCRPAIQFEEMKAKPLTPYDVKAKLLARTAMDMAHMMGQPYANAVNACLTFKELTQELNEFDRQKAFETKVLTVLKRAIPPITQ